MAADEFHQELPYPPLSWISSCLSYVRQLNEINNIRSLPVFDDNTSTAYQAVVAGPTHKNAHEKALDKLNR